MPQEQDVAGHYTLGNLLAAIEAGVAAIGKTTDTVTVKDLGPVDEFHIGGRIASEHFLDQMDIGAGDHVLDVGCGLGGSARFVADRYDARVSGIDLTDEFVATGEALSAWVGLEGQITLREGSALDMPFEDESFDAAYMMHVGMNINDKRALAAEVARVLRPGARFGIYDIMRRRDGALAYPVPWASDDSQCVVATPGAYRDALAAAGFSIEHELDRGDFALEFFKKMKANIAANGPPPLGLHIVFGEARAEKLANMIANISDGLIAPVEMIARKGG